MLSEPRAHFSPGRRAIVIGAGATGCGTARDLMLRGFQVTLVDQGDFAAGTSSRFHGMLQSGARYAVSDVNYAAECMRERRLIAGMVPAAVEPVGGLFVSLEEDPDEYAERFEANCRTAEIDISEVSLGDLFRAEPYLSRSTKRAFAIPDATINPWRLLTWIGGELRRGGARILLRHQVTAIRKSMNGTIEVSLEGVEAGNIGADVLVVAGGSWSKQISALAGQHVDLELTKGSIVVLAHRIVHRVINRCRYPSSHDIIVPTGTTSLFGTTSQIVSDPNTTVVRPEEIQELLEGATPMIPSVREVGFLRAWAGVRPLVKPPNWPPNKAVPRRHVVINHAATGFPGMFTVCGGSLTTHRSMAEDVANQVCSYLGVNAPCLTSEATSGIEARRYWQPASALSTSESTLPRPRNVCECEAVSFSAVDEEIGEGGITRLHDLRRRLRIGFGPCQGTFCGPRVIELLVKAGADIDPRAELCDFWSERLKGMASVAWGKQARQILLHEFTHRRILGYSQDASDSNESLHP